MSSNSEQPGLSLVFTDRDQNYYVIPVETFERGRVPAERKAEVEQLMREREVTGYYLALAGLAFAGGFALGSSFAVGVGFGYYLASANS